MRDRGHPQTINTSSQRDIYNTRPSYTTKAAVTEGLIHFPLASRHFNKTGDTGSLIPFAQYYSHAGYDSKILKTHYSHRSGDVSLSHPRRMCQPRKNQRTLNEPQCCNSSHRSETDH
jgi:hypothetical protein